MYTHLSEKNIENLIQFYNNFNEVDKKYFYPHKFTVAEIKKIINNAAEDLFLLNIDEDEKIIGYGLLRGWDQGYAIPSLGLAIGAEFRGRGYGKKFIKYLHELARKKNSKTVMLRVHNENQTAIELYKQVGYQFKTKNDDKSIVYFTGFVVLK